MSDDKKGCSLPTCFVAMPFGRNKNEQRWFKGWYEGVIEVAVTDAGYECILAAAEETSGAINDEIRGHLSSDDMVVIDLGGMGPEDQPNPNVMYELGIRHAFGLPAVLMAWPDQIIPFDVSNQRVISEPRDFLAQKVVIERLTSFIQNAANGKFYKPMDAVGRSAIIDAVAGSVEESSVLVALAEEVRSLRHTVTAAAYPRRSKSYEQQYSNIKRALGQSGLKKELHPYFVEHIGDNKMWGAFLRTKISDDVSARLVDKNIEEWKAFAMEFATRWISARQRSQVSEEVVEKVRLELPSQPWPPGIHIAISDRVGISVADFRKAVKVLIGRGVFRRQVDGELFDDGANSLNSE